MLKGEDVAIHPDPSYTDWTVEGTEDTQDNSQEHPAYASSAPPAGGPEQSLMSPSLGLCAPPPWQSCCADLMSFEKV